MLADEKSERMKNKCLGVLKRYIRMYDVDYSKEFFTRRGIGMALVIF